MHFSKSKVEIFLYPLRVERGCMSHTCRPKISVAPIMVHLSTPQT